MRWQFATDRRDKGRAAGVTPIYGGMLHHRLRRKGSCDPVPPEHPGTPILHAALQSRAGKFPPYMPTYPPSSPDAGTRSSSTGVSSITTTPAR